MNAKDWEKSKERIDRLFENRKRFYQSLDELEQHEWVTRERNRDIRKARRKRSRERKRQRAFNLKYYGSLKKPLVIRTSTAEFIQGAYLLTGQNLYKTCKDILDMLEELSGSLYIDTQLITEVLAVRGYAKRFGCVEFIELELPGLSKVIGQKNHLDI